MRPLKLILLAALLTTAGMSCKKITGHGPVVSELRNANNFSEINSEISGILLISQGNNYNVTVEGQQNILDQLLTEVEGHQLTIRFKNGVFISGEKIKIHITTPEVASLHLHGSGNIAFRTPLITTTLSLKISGSGNINLQDVEAEEMEAKISGSGAMTISGGSVRHESLHISGSGDMDFISLKAQDADITLTGSGDALVYVTDYLKAKISGSGDVYYKGAPAIDVDISGSGSLKRL